MLHLFPAVFTGQPTLTDDRSFEPGTASFDWMDNGAGTQIPDPTSVAYTHSKHLGTTRVTSNTASPPQAQDAVVYTAFGERICAVAGGCDASDPNPRYGYAGAWGYQVATSDTPTDAYATDFPFLHAGARYYDPATGRFLQRDPIGIRGGLNVYAYVGSTPTRGVDPTGLVDWWEAGKWAAGGFFLGLLGEVTIPTAIAMACVSGIAGGLEIEDIVALLEPSDRNFSDNLWRPGDRESNCCIHSGQCNCGPSGRHSD